MNSGFFPAKVINKRIKDGFFGTKYYAVLKFDAQINDLKETRLTANSYFSLPEVGETCDIKLYLHDDGLWRVYPRSD